MEQRVLGSNVLKDKEGIELRRLMGQLQSETRNFYSSSEVLELKAVALHNAAQTMSFALHEFATAIVQQAGAPMSPSVARPDMTAPPPPVNSPSEQSGLLEAADVLNTLAASMQIIDEAVREEFLLPLQQVRSTAATTCLSAEQEASEARYELENEGKKTAAQMSKKHREAEKNSADVAFGDLLKIQKSLKVVENRFETAAAEHLGAMLKVRYQSRSAVIGNILKLLPLFEGAFDKAVVRIQSMRKATDTFLNAELPKLAEKWEAETQRRDQLIAKAVQECLHGSAKHVEGYLKVQPENRK